MTLRLIWSQNGVTVKQCALCFVLCALCTVSLPHYMLAQCLVHNLHISEWF